AGDGQMFGDEAAQIIRAGTTGAILEHHPELAERAALATIGAVPPPMMDTFSDGLHGSMAPEIEVALADLYEAHIDDFATAAVVAPNDGHLPQLDSRAGLELGGLEARGFLEQIVGHEDATNRVLIATDQAMGRYLAEVAPGDLQGETVASNFKNSLGGMALDTVAIVEFDAADAALEDLEDIKLGLQTVVEVAGAAAGGGPGGAIGAGAELLSGLSDLIEPWDTDHVIADAQRRIDDASGRLFGSPVQETAYRYYTGATEIVRGFRGPGLDQGEIDAAIASHEEVVAFNRGLPAYERILDERGAMIPLAEMTHAQRYHLGVLAGGVAPGANASEFAYQVDLRVEHGESRSTINVTDDDHGARGSTRSTPCPKVSQPGGGQSPRARSARCWSWASV
ncbi:MAG: hypothetical protein ACRD0U_12930, partial [Acidimicrobiales bacterium]